MEHFVLKFRKDIIGGFALLLIATVAFGGLVGGALAQEGSDTDDVGITAQIEAWATLSITEASLTLSPYMVNSFGETAIASSTTGFTAGTNHLSGLTINIKSANASLDHTTETDVIESVSATGTTLSAGTDGYGVQCSTGTGVTCDTDFANTGEDVSPVTASDVTFATATSGTGKTGDLVVKAASSQDNPVGDYTDTITLTAVPGV